MALQEVIVQYDPTTCQLVGLDGLYMFSYALRPEQFRKVEETKSEVLELIRAGLSADDLIRLKKEKIL